MSRVAGLDGLAVEGVTFVADWTAGLPRLAIVGVVSVPARLLGLGTIREPVGLVPAVVAGRLLGS